MSESASCIFCKIVRGEIPAVKVHEDTQTLTFMDVRPASPGHALVISKAHAPNLLEIAEVDLLAVASTAAGLVTERWLFFAEAEHVSMLFYGKDAV